jgi:hypothetical protein
MFPGIVCGIRGYKRFDKRNRLGSYDLQQVGNLISCCCGLCSVYVVFALSLYVIIDAVAYSVLARLQDEEDPNAADYDERYKERRQVWADD